MSDTDSTACKLSAPHTCPEGGTLEFRPISEADMPLIWSYLQREKGRACDFSYGGLLMWVSYFHYEMAIMHDTLFIKGRLENDLSLPAFSMPVGALPLSESIELLGAYCDRHRLPLRFSAVPEYALEDFKAEGPVHIDPLDDWSDYLYEARKLATLSGKKMAKKRNHVNQYISLYGPDTYEPLSAANLPEVEAYMARLEQEEADCPQAAAERHLAQKVLEVMQGGDPVLEGGLLRIGGRVVAFTVGDRKGDTLFIHIEKADRDVAGSYEMINRAFAADMIERHPEIAYINREDDAGDEGLRQAKQSYHPLQLLRKYNVIL